MKSETIIRSRYTKRIESPTETGRPMHNNYQIRIDENGHKTLHKIGEHNLQAEINAQASECDIGLILEKYKGGDINALNKAQAGYVDLTTMPKNLQEAQNTVIRLQEEFKTLPIDVRRKFDHSPEKYVQEYGSKYWLEAMQIKPIKQEEPAKVTETKESEVKKSE